MPNNTRKATDKLAFDKKAVKRTTPRTRSPAAPLPASSTRKNGITNYNHKRNQGLSSTGSPDVDLATLTAALANIDVQDASSVSKKVIEISTYAEAANLARNFPDLAATVLSRPLPFTVAIPIVEKTQRIDKSQHTYERPNWAAAPDDSNHGSVDVEFSRTQDTSLIGGQSPNAGSQAGVIRSKLPAAPNVQETNAVEPESMHIKRANSRNAPTEMQTSQHHQYRDLPRANTSEPIQSFNPSTIIHMNDNNSPASHTSEDRSPVEADGGEEMYHPNNWLKEWDERRGVNHDDRGLQHPPFPEQAKTSFCIAEEIRANVQSNPLAILTASSIDVDHLGVDDGWVIPRISLPRRQVLDAGISIDRDEPDIALLHAGTDAQSVTDTSKVTSPELYHEIENEVQGISKSTPPEIKSKNLAAMDSISPRKRQRSSSHEPRSASSTDDCSGLYPSTHIEGQSVSPPAVAVDDNGDPRLLDPSIPKRTKRHSDTLSWRAGNPTSWRAQLRDKSSGPKYIPPPARSFSVASTTVTREFQPGKGFAFRLEPLAPIAPQPCVDAEAAVEQKTLSKGLDAVTVPPLLEARDDRVTPTPPPRKGGSPRNSPISQSRVASPLTDIRRRTANAENASPILPHTPISACAAPIEQGLSQIHSDPTEECSTLRHGPGAMTGTYKENSRRAQSSDPLVSSPNLHQVTHTPEPLDFDLENLRSNVGKDLFIRRSQDYVPERSVLDLHNNRETFALHPVTSPLPNYGQRSFDISSPITSPHQYFGVPIQEPLYDQIGQGRRPVEQITRGDPIDISGWTSARSRYALARDVIQLPKPTTNASVFDFGATAHAFNGVGSVSPHIPFTSRVGETGTRAQVIYATNPGPSPRPSGDAPGSLDDSENNKSEFWIPISTKEEGMIKTRYGLCRNGQVYFNEKVAQ